MVAEHRPASRGALAALYVVYGLNAVGLVPHMILLVDFVARGLGRGIAAGRPMLGAVRAGRDGRATDRRQARRPHRLGAALRLALAIQAVGVGMLAVSAGPASLALSSIVVGACVPGVVPLALGRVHKLVPHDGEMQRRAWVWCTVAFALGQAAAAYGFSALFALTGGHYPLLFALGAAAFVVALAIDLGAAGVRRRGAWR